MPNTPDDERPLDELTVDEAYEMVEHVLRDAAREREEMRLNDPRGYISLLESELKHQEAQVAELRATEGRLLRYFWAYQGVISAGAVGVSLLMYLATESIRNNRLESDYNPWVWFRLSLAITLLFLFCTASDQKRLTHKKDSLFYIRQ